MLLVVFDLTGSSLLKRLRGKDFSRITLGGTPWIGSN